MITSLALCTGMALYAQQDAGVAQPEPAPFEHSIYDECLMVAGAQSWEALHLDADQVARMTDLQSRYKAGAKAAKEQAEAEAKAAAKKNGTTKAGTKSAAPAAPKATAPAEAAVEEPSLQNDMTAPIAGQPVTEPVLGEEGADVSAAAPEATVETSYAAVDAELRTILTPAQLAVWERRCDTRTSMDQ